MLSQGKANGLQPNQVCHVHGVAQEGREPCQQVLGRRCAEEARRVLGPPGHGVLRSAQVSFDTVVGLF